MSDPCKHTHYHANGLVHTPIGVCDCDRRVNPELERRRYVEYARRMLEAHRPDLLQSSAGGG